MPNLPAGSGVGAGAAYRDCGERAITGCLRCGPVQIAALHYITLGKPVKGEVEVLAGLQDGDRLVASPAGLELDGKQIEAQR